MRRGVTPYVRVEAWVVYICGQVHKCTIFLHLRKPSFTEHFGKLKLHMWAGSQRAGKRYLHRGSSPKSSTWRVEAEGERHEIGARVTDAISTKQSIGNQDTQEMARAIIVPCQKGAERAVILASGQYHRAVSSC